MKPLAVSHALCRTSRGPRPRFQPLCYPCSGRSDFCRVDKFHSSAVERLSPGLASATVRHSAFQPGFSLSSHPPTQSSRPLNTNCNAWKNSWSASASAVGCSSRGLRYVRGGSSRVSVDSGAEIAVRSPRTRPSLVSVPCALPTFPARTLTGESIQSARGHATVARATAAVIPANANSKAGGKTIRWLCCRVRRPRLTLRIEWRCPTQRCFGLDRARLRLLGWCDFRKGVA